MLQIDPRISSVWLHWASRAQAGVQDAERGGMQQRKASDRRGSSSAECNTAYWKAGHRQVCKKLKGGKQQHKAGGGSGSSSAGGAGGAAATIGSSSSSRKSRPAATVVAVRLLVHGAEAAA
jgi:hypothetical protein